MQKVVIFDFDGVIVDSIREVFAVCKALLARHGLRVRTINEFTELYDENFYQAIVHRGFPRKELPRLMEELTSVLPNRMRHIKLFPGMKRALDLLRRKHEVVIITSNMTPVVKRYLRSHGIKVEHVIGGDIERSKVKKIERIHKKHPDAELVYIGDTKGDVVEGRKANVKVIAVTWGYHKREKLHGADAIVDDPRRLVSAVEGKAGAR